jgi:HEAT repeat protein
VRERRGRARAAAGLGVFALVLAYFALFVRYGINLDDEGTLLAQFYRTYLGEVPYRDFHMGYTPSGHYFQALLFHVFGVSIVPLRWGLAVCHSLTAALLFVIARRIMPAAFALLPALAYVAIMPFYPGEFASFNIPYPAWYVVLFWVAGFWAALRFFAGGRLWWIAASGLLNGLCFAFKPNVGLFQLASAGLMLLIALEPPAGGRAARLEGALWWLLVLGVGTGIAVVFASQASARDVRIFLLPLAVVLAAMIARRLAGRSADVPVRGLLVSGLVYAVAMLATVVPWVVKFLLVLGRQRFAAQVLFIGTGFEQYYYSPFHWAGRWDTYLVVAAVGIASVGLAVRARWLPIGVLAAGVGALAVAAVFALRRADMPEGVHAAVFSRLEDLSFTASLLVHWGALALSLPLLWKPRRRPREIVQLLILVSALMMYLQLYPRSDFMHLVAAVPLTLVLAAGLLARLASWLSVSRPAAAVVRWACVGAVLGLLLFRIAPNLASVSVWNGMPDWRAHAPLALERAPVTLELGRGPRMKALHDTVEYVRANTAPGETIFPFPAIELVCFLADRENATRHGYFFPGWPGHEVEAEVVAALRAAPPRLVVAVHGHQFFFMNAPVYYYALHEFMQEQYRQVATFGRYAVLARRDVPESELRAPADTLPAIPPALELQYRARLEDVPEQRARTLRALAYERLDFAWEPVVALLVDDDPRVRAAALDALASATDPGVAVPYAQAVLRGQLPQTARTVVLRRIWAFGDARVIRPLLEMAASTFDISDRRTVLDILDTVARKIAISDYWLGDAAGFEPSLGELAGRRHWRERLANHAEDMHLRLFLARILPRLGRSAEPALMVALGSDSADLRIAAAAGLIRLGTPGVRSTLMTALLPLAARDSVFVPPLLLALYHQDPAAARRPFARALAGPLTSNQIAIAWLVSATGDRQFRVPLLRMLRSPFPVLRLAALTGLQNVGDPRTLPAVRRAQADPDWLVREFAARALAAMTR